MSTWGKATAGRLAEHRRTADRWSSPSFPPHRSVSVPPSRLPPLLPSQKTLCLGGSQSVSVSLSLCLSVSVCISVSVSLSSDSPQPCPPFPDGYAAVPQHSLTGVWLSLLSDPWCALPGSSADSSKSLESSTQDSSRAGPGGGELTSCHPSKINSNFLQVPGKVSSDQWGDIRVSGPHAPINVRDPSETCRRPACAPASASASG